MQIYDSYLLKALDVKLPYSEEQPGSNDFYEGFQVKMEKLKIETHPKLRRKIHVPKKNIIPNPPYINLQQQKS